MDRVGSGWTHGLDNFLLLLLLLLNWAKKYILPATWDDKKNIHELVFQLSYKQNNPTELINKIYIN